MLISSSPYQLTKASSRLKFLGTQPCPCVCALVMAAFFSHEDWTINVYAPGPHRGSLLTPDLCSGYLHLCVFCGENTAKCCVAACLSNSALIGIHTGSLTLAEERRLLHKEINICYNSGRFLFVRELLVQLIYPAALFTAWWYCWNLIMSSKLYQDLRMWLHLE